MSPLVISTIVGALILTVLCLSDYSVRVVRTTHAGYYVAALLFLVINLAVYGLLVSFFLSLSGSGDAGTGAPPEVVPLVVAVLYFGAGAATVRLGQLEFNFYDRLIRAFSKLFSLEVDTTAVRTALQRSGYDRLKESLEHLHGQAKDRGWDDLSEEWEEIQNDSKLIEEHIKDLDETQEALEGVDGLKKLSTRIGQRSKELEEGLERRFRTHLFNFVFKNSRSEKQLREMLGDILPPLPPPTPSPRIGVVHATTAGLLFGLVIGFLLLAAGSQAVSANTWWIAAVSVSFFTTIFFFSMKTEELAIACLLGAFAGFAGHFVWLVLDLMVGPEEIDLLGERLSLTLIGTLYGLASGLIIFVFRKFWNERIRRMPVRIVTVAASGWIAFFLISLIIPRILSTITPNLVGDTAARSLYDSVLMGFVGALLNVGLAYACKLLRSPEPTAIA